MNRTSMRSRMVVMGALTSRILDSQIVGEELLFQVDVAPGATREYLVLPRTSLVGVPEPIVEAQVGFVPDAIINSSSPRASLVVRVKRY